MVGSITMSSDSEHSDTAKVLIVGLLAALAATSAFVGPQAG